MNRTHRNILGGLGLAAIAFAVAFLLPATANAVPQYVTDGAVQNSYGGFDLPLGGYCWNDGAVDATKATRPLCTAIRINKNKSACETGGTIPDKRTWSTGGVCNDLVNTTMAACNAQPDRLWNDWGGGTGVCAIVMAYDDRNDVTCALHGGTYVNPGTCTGTWVTYNAQTSYEPDVLVGTPPAKANATTAGCLSLRAPATSACAATTRGSSTTAPACATPKTPCSWVTRTWRAR